MPPPFAAVTTGDFFGAFAGRDYVWRRTDRDSPDAQAAISLIERSTKWRALHNCFSD
jgi:hypothetical protein